MSGQANTEERCHWKCRCGWFVSDFEYKAVNADVPCQRCDRPYSSFKRVKGMFLKGREAVDYNADCEIERGRCQIK